MKAKSMNKFLHGQKIPPALFKTMKKSFKTQGKLRRGADICTAETAWLSPSQAAQGCLYTTELSGQPRKHGVCSTLKQSDPSDNISWRPDQRYLQLSDGGWPDTNTSGAPPPRLLSSHRLDRSIKQIAIKMKISIENKRLRHFSMPRTYHKWLLPFSGDYVTAQSLFQTDQQDFQFISS